MLTSCFIIRSGLRARHFIQISEVVGFEVHNDDGTNFRQLLRLQVQLKSCFEEFWHTNNFQAARQKFDIINDSSV